MDTKSGTNELHGALWEFFRNDVLDAKNFFEKSSSPKPPLRQNQFGFEIGGPVFIPHLYNRSRQKTFFFYNEEWRREIQGNSPSPINSIPSADLVTTLCAFFANNCKVCRLPD